MYLYFINHIHVFKILLSFFIVNIFDNNMFMQVWLVKMWMKSVGATIQVPKPVRNTAKWSHYFPIFFTSVLWISYHFEFFHFTFPGIRDYDNALATSGAFGNSNGIAGQTASLPFAAGPCYEDPDKVAFYENPLAAPKVPQRNDSLEEHPGDPKDSSLYDNPNSPMDGSGACTIC